MPEQTTGRHVTHGLGPSHPTDRLRDTCERAARGQFPEPCWRVEFLPPPERVVAAVVAFTGHHIVASEVSESEARPQLDPDDIAAPFNPAFLSWLATRLQAKVGHIDITLACLGSGDPDGWLRPLPSPPDNERVRRALTQRVSVEFLAPPAGDAVVSLGTGLAGRRELSIEITNESDRGGGLGNRMIRSALTRLSSDEAVFAAVAPGNTRSMRCLLAAGFRPIGAECTFTPRDQTLRRPLDTLIAPVVPPRAGPRRT